MGPDPAYGAFIVALGIALGCTKTMTTSAIRDVITVVGSAYFQPIADLIDKLLKRPQPPAFPSGSGERENGYSVALLVLLVAVLESYTSRLRFVRSADGVAGSLAIPALLAEYFPSLPTKEELVEVFLARNAVAHNHLWHLDVSDFKDAGSPTLANPTELGFQTNQHYERVVDFETRRTRKVGINISPTAVDRTDVRKVFEVVWKTLTFMNAQDFSHTPLAGRTVGYRGKYRQFEELIAELTETNQGKQAH